MTSKFAHAEIKVRQRKTHAPKSGKGGKLVLAPRTLLLRRVGLSDGHTGTVIGYAGTASDQRYLVKLSTGEKAEYAAGEIARVE